MKVLYFGIYDPDFSRNKIYIAGLKACGASVIECRDASPGFLKYWRLWRKYQAIQGNYDALVVGYPGHVAVPLAKLIARAPVVADLLGSLADAETHSRGASTLRSLKNALIDQLAVRFADLVLLESEAQKRFFEARFGVSPKYRVLYTGADDSVFHCESHASKKPSIVLFRGRLTPESGIVHVLEAARLLKSERDIRFRIIGFGQLLAQTRATITRDGLDNVELIEEFLPAEKLREKMCAASLALGQFSDNPRLCRTIPHKAFESFAMGIPYLSGDSEAIREVIRDGITGFLTPLSDPEKLAQKIRELYADRMLLVSVGKTGQEFFQEHFTPRVLGQNLRSLIERCSPRRQPAPRAGQVTS